MGLRTPQEVAQRAIVMGAVAFRASVEVTHDARANKIASLIPKWLAALDLTDAIDPVEFELLQTPYGELVSGQRIDAYWSGEGAALFCWALGIGEQPPLFRIADHVSAMNTLHVMRAEAAQLLSAPALRSKEELLDFCKTVRLTRVILREMHTNGLNINADSKETATSLGRHKVRSELSDIGIDVSDTDFSDVRRLVTSASHDEQKAVTGAYVARDIAVTWLFDGRPRYFEND